MSFNYTLNGEELVVEEGTTAIPEFAFRQNNLFLTAIFPSTLETIGRFAFDETSLTEANLPNSLVTLEHGAFRRSDLTELVLPDSVVTIGDQAFDGSDLASVQLSDALTSIGDYAFYNTSLTQVTIPKSVQSIGQGAFVATNIQSVVVPASFAGNLPTDAFNLGTEITLSSESTTPPEQPVDAAVEVVTDEPTPAPVDAAVEVVTDEPTPPPVEAAAEVVTNDPTPAPVDAAVGVVTDELNVEPSAPRSAGSPATSTSLSSSAPSLRSNFEGLGAINKVIDSTQRVVDEVIQVGKSVIPSSSGEISVPEKSMILSSSGEISGPEKFVDRLFVDQVSAEKIALYASSRVKNLDLELQVPGLILNLKKVANSDIVFASGLNAEFVSTAKKMKKVSIVMFQGDDVVRFTDGVIKRSSVSTGQGDDLITLGEDVTVRKKTTFLLGQGSDEVEIQGAIKKMKIDLGDDSSADVVRLSADDLVSKKLEISNFNNDDQLIVDGDVFTYSDLRDERFKRIKVAFGLSSSINQMIDSSGFGELLDVF